MADLKTISAHTATLRKLVKQFSDDSIFDEEFLFKIFLDSRAVVLNRDNNKQKYKSPWNFQEFPVPLDLAEYVVDECLEEGIICRVRKSRFKIPRPFTTLFKDVMVVSTYSGTPISQGDMFDGLRLKYTKTMQDKPLWEIQNSFLIIHNALTLKAVKIKMIAENPLEVAKFPRCNSQGIYSDQTCFHPETEVIPLDADLNDAVYGECLKKLGIAFKIPQDSSNNDNSDIPPKI